MRGITIGGNKITYYPPIILSYMEKCFSSPLRVEKRFFVVYSVDIRKAAISAGKCTEPQTIPLNVRNRQAKEKNGKQTSFRRHSAKATIP